MRHGRREGAPCAPVQGNGQSGNLIPRWCRTSPSGPRTAAPLTSLGMDEPTIVRLQAFAHKKAVEETDRATYQAMEALVHNLNTMNSRAGAQVPFSSINYGMDTSPEGRMVMDNLLSGHGSRPGQRRDPHLPHPDLPGEGRRQLQSRRSQLRPVQAGHARLAPSGCSRTSPSWTRPSTCSITSPAIPRRKSPTWAAAPGSSATSMIRISEISNGRGNLSFTSINLPRLAIKANRNIDDFFDESGPDDGSGVSISCWNASKSRPASGCATIPSSWARACGWIQRKAGLGRRGAGGAQARHPVRGLHRPGGDA